MKIHVNWMEDMKGKISKDIFQDLSLNNYHKMDDVLVTLSKGAYVFALRRVE